MAHINQSRPDSGSGFQEKVFKTFLVVPFSLGSGLGKRASWILCKRLDANKASSHGVYCTIYLSIRCKLGVIRLWAGDTSIFLTCVSETCFGASCIKMNSANDYPESYFIKYTTYTKIDREVISL